MDAENAADSAPPARSRRGLIAGAIAIVLVGAVAGTAAIAAGWTARDGDGTGPRSGVGLATLEATPVPSDVRMLDELPEDLVHAPVDAAIMTWLDDLQRAVMSDPAFGTVAISPDRSTVTVTWYGSASPTLQEHVALAPEGVAVVIHPAAFPPAELQALVPRAMGEGFVPGLQIAFGAVENDGSGLHFGIAELPAGRTLEQIGEEIAAALGRPDVPVRVEVSGPIVPISG